MRPPSLVSSASLVSSNGASSVTEEKVPLGDGVFCSKAAYSKLINVEENHADWAYALLKGVFGEKAHRMRVRISNKCPENEKFSPNFLMVAKSLHRDWLIKQTIWDNSGQLHSKYSPAEVEKYVNALPAYLADRAYDMQGPRGANVKNAPEHRRNSIHEISIETKRKYKKRGQPLSSQQQLPQQSSHHDPISSELSSLQQLYQDVDNLQSHFIPPATSEAEPMKFQNVETTAATYTNL